MTIIKKKQPPFQSITLVDLFSAKASSIPAPKDLPDCRDVYDPGIESYLLRGRQTTELRNSTIFSSLAQAPNPPAAPPSTDTPALLHCSWFEPSLEARPMPRRQRGSIGTDKSEPQQPEVGLTFRGIPLERETDQRDLRLPPTPLP